MQATVVHFCDEMVFFPWVPFNQMHAMINISLDIMIGTWIQMTNFILKRTMWLFIDKIFIC
jgi:hypothetical protein